MRGMLLAAGLGTRLRPLTDELPKPVVPVGHEPLAASAMRAFVRAGVNRIDANAHHLAEAIRPSLAPFAADIPFEVHVESVLLGTGGGIRNAVRGGPIDEVLVVNGDIVFEPDVDALIRIHRATGAAASLVVRHHPDPFALGAVEVDADGRILRIAGAPARGPASAAAYVFTGTHLLGAEALAALPENGCVVRQAYQPLLARGARLTAVVDDSPWADLGTPAVYLAQNLARATSSVRGLVHPSARILGSLERCVVGAGATIGPNARLRDCVVWPGASIDRPLERGIVTRHSIVEVPG